MTDPAPDVKSVFGRAAEIADPAERAAFLDRACVGHPAVRAEVEELLAALGGAGSFMAAPAAPAGLTGAYDPPAAEAEGAVVGPYKLRQKIGEGGFGVVYMAEQEHPVRRMVALKIIKPGMDTAQVIARFESERQALALMDHPNIARVLDAGATESGRPYFVMELVKGVPITDFCDRNHMPAADRLRLFVSVCQAVQHAHHKGIIHRDIKPSNVMVTLHDGVPVVKVIDFGVAKATVQRLTEKTLFTAYGQMVGTPAYMSPEQAEMSGLDIDTRSDVYSLGVLLYELLTGTTPLEAKRLRQAGYAEIQRLIREEEPPRPSTRLSSLGESATALAGNRGTDARQLARLLAADLDWVVMKALEKDRNRRYGTPADFAADVERYLRHDAILARPPSAAYRLRKFARRNRAAVLTGAAVAAALVAGTAAATWQAVAATRARQEALAALAEKEEARLAEAEQRRRAEENERQAAAAAAAERRAKETAQEREAESRAVLEFVQNKVFAAARPEGQDGGLGRDVTVRRAVEAALPFVEHSFTRQPVIEARLRTTLGQTFGYLGDHRTAAEQFERALVLFTRHRGPDHPDTLSSRNNVAISYFALGRQAEAVKLGEGTLALRQTVLGPDHPDTLSSMNNLAVCYYSVGRLADALALREQLLPLRRDRLGPTHVHTLQSMHNLAVSYDAVGRHAEALKLREESLPLWRAKFGPDHPDTLSSMAGLASCYHALRRHPEALKLHEEVLAIRKAKLGPDHPDTLSAMHNLAASYRAVGRRAEARKLYAETLALREVRLGPDHPDTLENVLNLAISLNDAGRRAEALRLCEDALATARGKLRPDHPTTLRGMNMVAEYYLATSRYAEAANLYREALAAQRAKLGPAHLQTLHCMQNLALAYVRLGRYADAIKLGDESVALHKARFGPTHPDTLSNIRNLASYLAHCPDAALRDPERAARLAAEAVAAAPQSANSHFVLGSARYRTGDWKGAVAALDEAVRLRKLSGGLIDAEGFFLAMAHWRLGEKEKARGWFDKAAAEANLLGPSDPEAARFRAEAAELLGVGQKGPAGKTSQPAAATRP